MYWNELYDVKIPDQALRWRSLQGNLPAWEDEHGGFSGFVSVSICFYTNFGFELFSRSFESTLWAQG